MLRVSDIMTPNPKTVEPGNSISTAIRIMQEGGFHHLPVVNEGRLVGIVHANDIRRGLGMTSLPENAPAVPHVWDAVPVRNVMQLVRQKVTPDTPVRQAITLMRNWALTGLPVLEGDELVGMVTLTDVLRITADLLETVETESAPPAVAFVGRSGSGKTTLIEQLVVELQKRGYVVGVIKHHAHDTLVDKEGKDTWRYAQVGASPVTIVSPRQTAVFVQTEQELPLDVVIHRYYRHVDLILIEGYRWSDKPRIEVHRQERSETLLCTLDEVVAIVSDKEWKAPCPVFSLDDVDGIATFLEERFLAKAAEQEHVGEVKGEGGK